MEDNVSVLPIAREQTWKTLQEPQARIQGNQNWSRLPHEELNAHL